MQISVPGIFARVRRRSRNQESLQLQAIKHDQYILYFQKHKQMTEKASSQSGCLYVHTATCICLSCMYYAHGLGGCTVYVPCRIPYLTLSSIPGMNCKYLTYRYRTSHMYISISIYIELLLKKSAA